VSPVGDGEGWTQDPWGGALVDGSIYGRGACDMKCGTTASIFTFLYLHSLREELHWRLTLSAVSDEETFGPWGARYLAEHHPEVFGDCCLNDEPSSPWTLRFGEKGPLRLEFTVRTRGAHGAYTHLSKSATASPRRSLAISIGSKTSRRPRPATSPPRSTRRPPRSTAPRGRARRTIRGVSPSTPASSAAA
jgi:succinyl-diaminopimelate desuccinylase